MRWFGWATIVALSTGLAITACSGDDDEPGGYGGSPSAGGASGAAGGGTGGTSGGPAGDAAADAPAEASASTVTVQVGATGNSFTPAEVTISVGDTVRWEFVGIDHTVTSGTGCTADDKFCSPSDANCSSSPSSAPGASYEHTFTEPGTYPYFCIPHCLEGMTGSVSVNP